jgi:hypothetical protein
VKLRLGRILNEFYEAKVYCDVKWQLNEGFCRRFTGVDVEKRVEGLNL